jgi:hypothetical protein
MNTIICLAWINNGKPCACVFSRDEEEIERAKEYAKKEGKHVFILEDTENVLNEAKEKLIKKIRFWQVSDVSEASYLGMLEFQDNANEWHNFEVLATNERLVFGGACNVGFIESGFMPINEDETQDEALQELLAELETFYNDGKQYTTRLYVTDRM